MYKGFKTSPSQGWKYSSAPALLIKQLCLARSIHMQQLTIICNYQGISCAMGTRYVPGEHILKDTHTRAGWSSDF